MLTRRHARDIRKPHREPPAEETAADDPVAPPDPVTFAVWVKAQGLDVLKLAAELSVNKSTVWRLLAGQTWPSAHTARQIYELTGGSVRYWDVADHAAQYRPRVPRKPTRS